MKNKILLLISLTIIVLFMFYITNKNLNISTDDYFQNFLRGFLLFSGDSYPFISFISPTPPNGTITTNTTVQINVSITDSSLGEFKYNWNGTNYTIYDNNLILHVSFDNNSDLGESHTSAKDLSTFNDNLSCYLAADCPEEGQPGVFGKSARFTFQGMAGSPCTTYDCGYIIPGNQRYNISDMTFSAWLYFNTTVTYDDHMIIMFGNGNLGASSKYWNIYETDDNAGAYGKLQYQCNKGSGAMQHNSTAVFNLTYGNKWTHVAVTKNDTLVKIYFNGVLDSSQATQAACVGYINPYYEQPRAVTIGADPNKSGGTEGWHGYMDEIRVYNVTLSEDAITQLYMSNLQKYNLTQWYFYTNQSQNATAQLTNGTYTYFASAKNSTGGESLTDLRTIIINTSYVYLAPDTTYPTFSNYWDNNATLIGNGIALFNVTLANTNGTVFMQINNTNYTATNLTASVYNVSVNLSAGTYSYYWGSWGNGTSYNYNISGARSYTVNTTDLEYPIFYNYTDNNATLNGSGIATFSVNVNMTNGTVLLNINGSSYLATNLSNWFNVSLTLINGTYLYNWTAYGNGTSHNQNTSANRYYTLNQTQLPPSKPILNSPANGSTVSNSLNSTTLSINVSAPQGGNLNVTFYAGIHNITSSNWTLVHMSDLHIGRPSGYQSSATVKAMNNWTINNKTTLNIQFVSNTGDLVDDDNCYLNANFPNASDAMSILDNQMPWLISPGNHEHYVPAGFPAGCISLYNQYFNYSRFTDYSWYKGHYSSTDNTNSYGLFTIGNQKIGIMHLDQAPDASELAWANDTIYANPTYQWVIATHQYMSSSTDPDPDCTNCARGTQGDSIFNALSPNSNVFMVLSGHHVDPHSIHRNVTGLGGQKVIETMTDYQNSYQDEGRLRYYVFSPSNNKIYAYTYAVMTGTYITSSDAQFVVDWNQPQGAETTYVQICNNASVASGSTVTCNYTGLINGTVYDWYVNVSNGMTTQGDIWNFTYNYTADAGDITPPNVTFNYQNPSDLNLSNFIGPEGVNISYNISLADLNYSTVKLYYKSNSTVSNIEYYQNGTQHSGYFSANYNYNNSGLFSWQLTDNYVLPGVYNYGEVTLENTEHSSSSLTSNTQYALIELLNVSNSTQYSFFEIMANRSSGNGGLKAYYCNSSYSTGNPLATANCYNFYTLTSNTYSHTHTAYSSHMVLPFTINETSGLVGSVAVTPISYFLIRGQSSTTWNYYYITNTSRANAYKTTINNGLAWNSQTYTIDAHLHQFGTNTSLWYYACANDTSNNQNCTAPRQDLFELLGLPPTSPSVYAPSNQTYYKNQYLIDINYTSSNSPNGYAISFYNISLMNADETFNQTIANNNSNNLNYSWNATNIADGTYEIRVTACDINNQCSSGFSENFTLATLDTIYPIFSIFNSTPANNTAYTSGATYRFNVTLANTNGTVGLDFNNANYTASNLSSVFNASVSDLAAGTYSYYWWAYGNGTSHNYNISLMQSYTVAKAAQSITSLLNGNNANLVITYPQQINVSYSGTNYTTLTIKINGTSVNIAQNYTWGAGGWVINYSAITNQNYSDYSAFLNLTINQASGNVNGTINGTQGNFTAINGTANQNIWLNATNITGYGTGKIYLNGSIINSGTMPLSNLTNLTIGFYNITFVYDGNQNYTSDANVWWVNVTSAAISDTTAPNVTLNFPSNGQNLTYSNVTFNCSVADNSDLKNVTLYFNSSGTTGTTTTTLVWQAYNDLFGYSEPASYPNITNINRNHTAYGNLVAYATNATLSAYVDLAGGGYNGGSVNTTAFLISGTDAYNIFEGKLNLTDAIWWYGSPVVNHTINITGLNSSRTYRFVHFADRRGWSASTPPYNTRWSTVTISDIDSFVVNSSSGVILSTLYATNDSATYLAGNNPEGYVAAWTNINPGADGDILITVWSNTSYHYSSAFLIEEYSTTSTGISGISWHANQTNTVTGILNQTTFQLNLTNGSYTWNCYVCDASNNCNFSASNFTFNISGIAGADTTYPTFSNYWDNNATLIGNGIALFNVTLTNTNGTVFMQINNTNYTATNLTASVYNVSVNLSAGTYSYYWGSWGNGTSHNYNISGTRSYTVNTTPSYPVFGIIHSIHTTISDGDETQSERVANLKSYYDWAATVEHDYTMTDAEYTSVRNEANGNNTDNNFTYFVGYEWKSNTVGGSEVLIFFTDNGTAVPARGTDAGTDTFTELTDWLKSSNATGCINHPGRTQNLVNWSLAGVYNTTYLPCVEMSNKIYLHWNDYWNCSAGSGCTTYANPTVDPNGFVASGGVKSALDKGYHLGFVAGWDYHDLTAAPNNYIGLVNPPNWTRGGIVETIRARHTWAAQDKMVMNVTLNNGTNTYFMGDLISLNQSIAYINYSISAAVGKNITNLSLFSDGIITNYTSFANTENSKNGFYIINITDTNEHYYFIEAMDSNGSRAWNSPMYISYPSYTGPSVNYYNASLIQQFSLSTLSIKSDSFLRRLFQQYSISNIALRMETSLRSLQQLFSLNNIVSRLEVMKRTMAQSFSLRNIVNKNYFAIRGLSNQFNLNNVIRNNEFFKRLSSNQFSLNNVVIRNGFFWRAGSQQFALTTSVNKLLGKLRSPYVIFNLNSITSEKNDFFRNIIQRISGLFVLFSPSSPSGETLGGESGGYIGYSNLSQATKLIEINKCGYHSGLEIRQCVLDFLESVWPTSSISRFLLFILLIAIVFIIIKWDKVKEIYNNY